MTYREQLNKIKEMGFLVCDLAIAEECDCVFDFEYTEEEFNLLCEMVKDCYLSCDLSIHSIAYAISDFIANGKSIARVLQMDTLTIILKASYYE